MFVVRVEGKLRNLIDDLAPRVDGYHESFSAKSRHVLLDGFHSLAEARIVVDAWRRRHETVRPHSLPRDRPPALKVGSVYETVMGFTVLAMRGPALAIKAGKNKCRDRFVAEPDARLTATDPV